MGLHQSALRKLFLAMPGHQKPFLTLRFQSFHHDTTYDEKSQIFNYGCFRLNVSFVHYESVHFMGDRTTVLSTMIVAKDQMVEQVQPSGNARLSSKNDEPPFRTQCSPDSISNDCITNDLHPEGNLTVPFDAHEIEKWLTPTQISRNKDKR